MKRDYTGYKIGKITVISRAPDRENCKASVWNCVCQCGKKFVAQGSHIGSGHYKSCGCTKKSIDITNQKFGKLTAIKRIQNPLKPTQKIWLCKCDCGKSKLVITTSLRSGYTKSCGCLIKRVEPKQPKRIKRFILPIERTKTAWRSMLHRCQNPKAQMWRYYGGRGITVCKRWLKFENFYKDMGEPPTSEHSLDRIDNSKNYCKSNCRWATIKEQQNNTSNNHTIYVFGKRITIAQASELYKLRYNTIRFRLKRGWDAEKAVSTPSLIPRYFVLK